MLGPGAWGGSLGRLPQLPCSLSALSLNSSLSRTVFLLLCLYGPQFPSLFDHLSLSKVPLAIWPLSAFTFPERPLPLELAPRRLPTGSLPFPRPQQARRGTALAAWLEGGAPLTSDVMPVHIYPHQLELTSGPSYLGLRTCVILSI